MIDLDAGGRLIGNVWPGGCDGVLWYTFSILFGSAAPGVLETTLPDEDAPPLAA